LDQKSKQTLKQKMTTMPSAPQTPLVAVTSDVKQLDGYNWHACVETYLLALADVAGAVPVLVPSLGARIDIEALLNRVDGVLVTGSRSNVYPTLYGMEPDPSSEPYDHDRDATTLPLIRAALARDMPVLAICRGFQEMNVALGGTLISEVQELDGRDDHRAPQAEIGDNDRRFEIRQDVTVAPDTCLAALVGAGVARVNSLHRQAAGTVAPGLSVEATAPDGTVEAFSVKDAKRFALGIQWHPEYWAASDPTSRAIFEGFGGALRAYAAEKAGSKITPEAAE